MKKIIVLSSFAILGLSSCKKDWVCECTHSDPLGPQVTENKINDETENYAEKICDALDEEGGASNTCRLIGFK